MGEKVVGWIMVAAVCCGAVTPVFGQDHGKKKKSTTPSTPEAAFQMMDSNSDGKLTYQEYHVGMTQQRLKSQVMGLGVGTKPAAYELMERNRFKEMDKDGNGILSLEEYKAGGKLGGKKMPQPVQEPEAKDGKPRKHPR